MKKVVTFTQDKVTKNTVRYQETGDREQHSIGTLYIQKRAFGDGPAPQTVQVAILTDSDQE